MQLETVLKAKIFNLVSIEISTMPKKKGQRAYQKGANLENRAARWLKAQFGYKYKKRDLARGSISKRPYEVDIHGIKEELFGLLKTHLWVEAKAYKIKRTHVTKLVESARDVKDAFDEEIETWSPNILMLVSSKGFDVDAIGLADKYRIYCIEAGKNFKFVGKMDRENFEDRGKTEY